jgi:hypothetical protein
MRNIEVANLLGTRPETVSRWNQGRAYPHGSTEKALLELECIVDQLPDLYEPQEARQWMFAPQKLLQGVAGRTDPERADRRSHAAGRPTSRCCLSLTDSELIQDQGLLDRLSTLPVVRFAGEVFRITGQYRPLGSLRKRWPLGAG